MLLTGFVKPAFLADFLPLGRSDSHWISQQNVLIHSFMLMVWNELNRCCYKTKKLAEQSLFIFIKFCSFFHKTWVCSWIGHYSNIYKCKLIRLNKRTLIFYEDVRLIRDPSVQGENQIALVGVFAFLPECSWHS